MEHLAEPIKKDLTNLYELFKAKLEAVSGECYRVATAAEAGELAGKVLQLKGVQDVVLTESKLIQACELRKTLNVSGLKAYTDDLRKWAPEVDAGITEVRWAIAETGTLVQDGTDVNERLCSTLPPIHVALVLTTALVPSLAEALHGIHSLPQVPGFIGFISGPSRTSDIERVLTIGVHGPEQLVVIFVDQAEEVA